MIFEDSATMEVELEDGSIEVRPAALVYEHRLNGSQRLLHAEPSACPDTELVMWRLGLERPLIVKRIFTR